MIELPLEEIKLLAEWAKAHDMALGSSMDEQCIVILMGKKTLSINEAAIVCAFMLLQGILNGAWSNINEEKKSEGIKDDPPLGHTH